MKPILKLLAGTILITIIFTFISCKKDSDVVTYSKAFITKIKVTSIPFKNSTGANWDLIGGPDVYYTINNEADTVLLNGREKRITDVTGSSLPIIWELTSSFQVPSIQTAFFIKIWDYDNIPIVDPDDDLMGICGPFVMKNLTTYPSTISFTDKDLSIIIDIRWEK